MIKFSSSFIVFLVTSNQIALRHSLVPLLFHISWRCLSGHVDFVSGSNKFLRNSCIDVLKWFLVDFLCTCFSSSLALIFHNQPLLHVDINDYGVISWEVVQCSPPHLRFWCNFAHELSLEPSRHIQYINAIPALISKLKDLHGKSLKFHRMNLKYLRSSKHLPFSEDIDMSSIFLAKDFKNDNSFVF